MTDVKKDEAGPVIAWQLLAPLPTSARHEEDLQGALRGDIALIDEVEKKATAWMDRRQLAFGSGLKALGEMSACNDPVTVAAIYGRWLCGSMNRLAEDVQDAQDFAVKAATVGHQTIQAMIEGFPIPRGTKGDSDRSQ